MISVIIPTYKNQEQLEHNLKHNLQYLHDCEVIVINDYPEDNLEEMMQNFPQVTLIQNKHNLGFAGTVNEGFKVAKGEYVLLINSDVLLLNEDYKNALKFFEDNKDLFAVSFAQKEKDESIVGKNKIYWQKGFFRHTKNSDLTTGINGWAEGGSCLIDRNKFNKIGMFDTIFSPFYWEDIDLSYRAWKHGYQILFDREVLVEHHHESTIGKYFDSSRIKSIAFRNQLLFIWKNITDTSLLLNHVLYLPYFVIYTLCIERDMSIVRGLKQALEKKNQIKRYKSKLTDGEVLQKFSHS
jgi:GT2 family glycosyltransferase